MPFKKVMSNRRKFFRKVTKRPSSLASKTTRSLFNTAKNAVKTIVQSQLEHKEVDTLISGALGAGNKYSLLNGMQQGAGDGQRVGNLTKNISLQLSGYVQAVTQKTVQVMVYLVHQRDPNGTGFTVGDVWNTVTPASGALRLKARIEDFQVIWKKRYNLYGGTAAGDNDNTKMIDKYIRLDIPTRYNGNAGTIADIYQGALYLCIYSSSHADTVWYMQSRLTYTD